MNTATSKTSAVIVVVAFAIVLPVQAGTPAFHTVALSGNQAPGTPAGVTFLSFSQHYEWPVIDDSGNIAFRARLTGTGVTGSNDVGIWRELDGTLLLVAREGDQAPGLPAGILYNSLQERVVISDDTSIVYLAHLTGAGINGTNDRCIYSDASGSLEVVAREGDVPPGVGANTSYDSVDYVLGFGDVDPVLSGNGKVAFTASLTGSGVAAGSETGIWSDVSGALALLARTAPDPQGPDDLRQMGQPLISTSGVIGFVAVLGNSRHALFRTDGATLTRIAASGDPAPGAAAGVTFAAVWAVGIDSAGHMAFLGSLSGPGVTSANDFGVWQEDEDGVLQLVVREGDSAPGFAGVTFVDTGFDGVASGNGAVGLAAVVTGPGSDYHLWTQDAGQDLRFVTRLGNQAFDMPPGIVFTASGFPSHTFPSDNIVMNEQGDLMFQSYLSGPGITSANNQALFLWHPDEPAVKMLQRGDVVTVAPADNRTVSLIWSEYLSGGDDGRRTSLNSAGQMALRLDFSDGSMGLFTLTPPLAAECELLGDLNGDGAVNGLDLQGFERCLFNAGANCLCGDLDGDGLVDHDDLESYAALLVSP